MKRLFKLGILPVAMRISLTTLLVLCGNVVHAQPNKKKIDSLQQLLQRETNPNSKMAHYFQVGMEYAIARNFEKSKENAEYLRKVAKKSNSISGTSKYHLLLSRVAVDEQDFEDAKMHGHLAAEGFKKVKDTSSYMLVSYNIGFAELMTGVNKNNVISTFNEALNYGERSKDSYAKAKLYAGLCSTYSSLGRYGMALSNIQTSLEYFIKAKKPADIARCYALMGSICIKLEDWESARKYMLLFIDTAQPLPKRLDDYAKGYNYMGIIEMHLGNYESALKYIDKSMADCKKYNLQVVMAYNYHTKAEVCLKLKKYDDAITFSKNALDIIAPMGAYAMEIELFNFLRLCYFNLNDKANTIIYNDKLQTNLDDMERDGNTMSGETYKKLSDAELEMGNYKKAYGYYSQYVDFDKDRNLTEKNDRVNELQAKFELTDKENKLKDLTIEQQKNSLQIADQKTALIDKDNHLKDLTIEQQENSLQIASQKNALTEKNNSLKDFTIKQQKDRLQLASQENTILLTFGGLAILLLLASVIFWRYRINRKNNRILAAKNDELEISENALRKSVGEKELLLKEIHHRVKNNLQLVISLLNIQAEENNIAEVEDFLEKGRSRIVSMALIHQNLYETDDIAKVDFQEYLEHLADTSLESLRPNDVSITFDIKAKDVYFDIQTSIPLGLIINELITNAMKHAFVAGIEGIIRITIEQSADGNFRMVFSDNGKGMNTGDTGHKSFGIELVNLLAAQMDGDITVTVDGGTIYTMTFEDRIAA